MKETLFVLGGSQPVSTKGSCFHSCKHSTTFRWISDLILSYRWAPCDGRALIIDFTFHVAKNGSMQPKILAEAARVLIFQSVITTKILSYDSLHKINDYFNVCDTEEDGWLIAKISLGDRLYESCFYNLNSSWEQMISNLNSKTRRTGGEQAMRE